jgi:fused signal recognition particle receptor
MGMGFFDKFRDGLKKTQDKLAHEIRRIVTFSPKLTEATLEELEMALIAADFGTQMSSQIVEAVRVSYETQGGEGLDVFAVARGELQKTLALADHGLTRNAEGLTVVPMVGVNGTGKTTTAAKLAHHLRGQGLQPMLAACDTFRAAAIEQLKLWG